jgi:hypothetical protein
MVGVARSRLDKEALTMRTLCLLLIAAMGMAVAIVAAPSRATADDAAQASPLHKQMEILQDAVKQLRRQVKDPARNPQSLELVVQMQTSVILAKTYVPPLAQTLPEEKRPEFLMGYRKKMIELADALLELELALLDGKNAQAEELLKKSLELRFKGHQQFKGEE